MNEDELKSGLQKAWKRAGRTPPAFAETWAAAEARHARSGFQRKALAGVAAAAALAVVIVLLPEQQVELADEFLIADALMNSTSWTAPSDVLMAEVTIVEGWTWRQMRATIDRHPELAHDTAGKADRELLAMLGSQRAHPEGLFHPSTYRFSPGAPDIDVYRQAFERQASILKELWESRQEGLPLADPYEALVLASIVEKETGRVEDRAKVASVFVNRLRIGMRLQSDPTTIYGLGSRFDGNLRKRDLLEDSAYNTYTRAGLPPTPIALPGKASIAAALNPVATRALYFVARGDGSSEFSESLEAHNRAVARYQLRQ